MEFHTNNADDQWFSSDFDENDALYAELRRQVLLLTAEDDDDDHELEGSNSRKAASVLQHKLKNRSSLTNATTILQHGCYYYNWSGDEATESVPSGIFKLWRTGHGYGHGTGVFIPQIANSRRRLMPRRKNNDRGRMYQKVETIVEKTPKKRQVGGV